MPNFGERRVADARSDQSVIADLAELTGLSDDTVRDRLSHAHGAKTLRKLFNDVWPATPQRLADRTVAFARRYELHDEIRGALGATPHLVTRRLNAEPGQALLRNVFAEQWPEETERAFGNTRDERSTNSRNMTDAPSDVEVGSSTDESVEPETTGGDLIVRPFDPNKIRVKLWTPTIDLVLKRIKANEIDLAPDFQRAAGIWKDRAQSRLIESLLIRIPLPAFYVDASDEDHLLVIDGIQRLTAVRRFALDGKLTLSGLEYLTELNGKSFSELPRPFQRRIEETMLTVHLIDKGTPEEAKLNIFKRLNTGGEPLTLQEIRHAMNPGPVRAYLKELAALESFARATEGRFSDDRMTDRECALRFCAFFLKAPAEYPVHGDLDTFLQETMRSINVMSDHERDALRARFDRALRTANQVLENEAFRKPSRNGRRAPVNKALFETWTVGFDALSDADVSKLVRCRKQVRSRFQNLVDSNRDFLEALSQGTGDPRKVKLRFSAIDNLLRAVVES